MGSAVTRNRGISASTGEYVTFLDDDDVYLPEKVERQVAAMVRADADYSITDLLLVSESERPIEYRRRDYIKGVDQASLMRYHYMHHMTGTDTLMFRKDYLLKIGGFPPIDMGDEFYLMKEAIAASGRFIYLAECGVRAYVHSSAGGMSSGQRKVDFENDLYREKQAHFDEFDAESVAYIKMRHWAVLAFAELRRRRIGQALLCAGRSFIASPSQCVTLVLRLK